MTRKKVYAVAVGRSPGIYDNWPEAERQIKGYPGARFKGFADRLAAEAWLRDPQYETSVPSRKKGEHPPAAHAPREGEISIYTDGGCSRNPGPGGYGAILVIDGVHTELSGGFSLTTNNRMELMACIVALRALQQRDLPVTVYSDSSYVVNGISKGWARGWRKRGWVKSDRQPAVNPDLWGELLDLVEALTVSFQWVKGHAGHPLNERCDQLAVTALKQSGLPADTGYRGP